MARCITSSSAYRRTGRIFRSLLEALTTRQMPSSCLTMGSEGWWRWWSRTKASVEVPPYHDLHTARQQDRQPDEDLVDDQPLR